MSSLLSVTRAARRLKIHPFSVRRLIGRGILPAEVIGRTWVLSEEDVTELAKTYVGRKGRPRKKRNEEEKSL